MLYKSVIRLSGKEAIEPGWQRYCDETRDPVDTGQIILAGNYGVPTGKTNDILVIDVDNPLVFDPWYLAEFHAPPPETFTVKTAKGYHLYYKYPATGREYRNKSVKDAGFDIRGHGGYVVGEGSIHPDTKEPYRIINPHPPVNFPDGLRALIYPSRQESPRPSPQQDAPWNGDLNSLPIPEYEKQLITGATGSQDRSSDLIKVLNTLTFAGLSDTQILSIIDSNPIGEKSREKAHPAEWLIPQIGKARAFSAEHYGDYAPPEIDFSPVTPQTTSAYSQGILEVSDFLGITLPERKSIMHPWLKESSFGMLVAPRGVGKTWFAVALIDAVSRGMDFGPWAAHSAVRALYVEAEMAAQDVQERFRMVNPLNHRKEKLLVYSEGYASLKGASRGSLLNPEWRKFMKDFLLKNQIAFWIVDNLSSLSPGIDENSKKDGDVINQWFLSLRFAGVASMLVHHTGKNGDQRGTSGREDNLDYVIQLSRPVNYAPEEGARFIAHFSKARVANTALPLIQDTEFTMSITSSGQTQWIWSKVQADRKKEVAKGIAAGLTTKEMAEMIGVSTGTISKIRARLIAEGVIDPCKRAGKDFAKGEL